MDCRRRSRRSHVSMTQRREDKTTSSPEPRDSPSCEPRRLWLAFACTQVIAALWALEHERFSPRTESNSAGGTTSNLGRSPSLGTETIGRMRSDTRAFSELVGREDRFALVFSTDCADYARIVGYCRMRRNCPGASGTSC